MHETSHQSALIITYGRSGSTLLQGMLNAADGVVIRGENFNLAYGLFQAYRSIEKTRQRSAPVSVPDSPTRPFFGASRLDSVAYLKWCRELMRQQLVGDEPGVTCYGFKEIRYARPDVLPSLDNYLQFLRRVFPRPLLIMNTRRFSEVAASGFWKQRTARQANFRNVRRLNTYFARYVKRNRDHSFHIRFRDVVEKRDGLYQLLERLDIALPDATVDNVLRTPHSCDNKDATLARSARSTCTK